MFESQACLRHDTRVEVAFCARGHHFCFPALRAPPCSPYASRVYVCLTRTPSAPQKKHAYKFIVDDEWRFAPDQPTAIDAAGNVNNICDLTNFTDDSEVVRSRNGMAAVALMCHGRWNFNVGVYRGLGLPALACRAYLRFLAFS